MSIFLRKKNEAPELTGIAKLSLIGFFSALAVALTSTIWALYIDSFVHSMAKVGLITGLFALISFFAHFAIVPLVEKSDKTKLYLSSLLFFVFSYIALALTKNFWLFMALGFFITIFQAVRITTFGIIVKDKSPKTKLTRNEGLIYTFFNLAFLVGPLIAGFLAEELTLRAVLYLASTIFLMSIILFKSLSIKDKRTSKKIDTNYLKNFFGFFKSRDRVIAYILSGGVQLWWSFIYIFIPLLIVRKGLGTMWVGYFLFAIVIPLILLEYKFANKAFGTGFKKFFKAGYLIAAIASLISFFFSNIFVIMSILVLASIGLAMLEPTIEAYFFLILKKDEEDRFYSPFQTAVDVNFFVGKILAAIILLLLPFKFLFLLFSLLMFILFVISTKTREITPKKSQNL